MSVENIKFSITNVLNINADCFSKSNLDEVYQWEKLKSSNMYVRRKKNKQYVNVCCH